MDYSALRSAAATLGVPLSDAAVGRFARFAEILREWNARLNLTAIDDLTAIERLHFIDALVGLRAMPSEQGRRVIDVGTGGGLPGLALRIARPDIRLTLLDATAKKARYLEVVRDELGLGSSPVDDESPVGILGDGAVDGGNPVEILVGRAEDLGRDPRYRESWDVALARALAPMPVLVELCLPLVRIGGRVIAWKKRDQDDELQVSGRAVSILGGRRLPIVSADLVELPPDRALFVVAKERPTPKGFPRLPGMPKKMPLV